MGHGLRLQRARGRRLKAEAVHAYFWYSIGGRGAGCYSLQGVRVNLVFIDDLDGTPAIPRYLPE